LRARRLRVALWIAVIEGALVVFDVISWWLAVGIAAAVLALYLFVGRNARADTIRQASWIAAASQTLMVLVPILFIIVGTLALVAVGILAVVALVFLFSERR
jgi:hypothetical protein